MSKTTATVRAAHPASDHCWVCDGTGEEYRHNQAGEWRPEPCWKCNTPETEPMLPEDDDCVSESRLSVVKSVAGIALILGRAGL